MADYTFDLEVFPNYFLCLVLDHEHTTFTSFECWKSKNHLPKLRRFFSSLQPGDRVFSYNGWYYDLVLLHGIMTEKYTTSEEIYAASKQIIEGGERRRAPLTYFDFLNIDLQELHNLKISLKKAAGYINFPRLADIPVQPGTVVDLPQVKLLRTYAKTDVEATAFIARSFETRSELELREFLIQRYKLSSYDITLGRPRIATACIASQWAEMYGDAPPYNPSPVTLFDFSQLIHPKLTFKTKPFRQVLKQMRNFSRREDEPRFSLSCELPGGTYTLGEGGLHDDFGQRTGRGNLLDIDVSSYYPYLMLNLKALPKHLPGIRGMIESMVDDRISFKKNGEKVAANGMKIVINSLYGMLGNQYSFMFAPEQKLKVCLNGQLFLLKLIELLFIEGVHTVYANTDGIVVQSSKIDTVERVVGLWSKKLRLSCDVVPWDAMYCLNTNDYFWVRGSTVKTKKTFARQGHSVSTRLNMPAVAEAVRAHIIREVDIRTALEGMPKWMFCVIAAPTKRYLVNRLDIDGAIGGTLPKTVRYYHARRGGRLYKHNLNTGGEIQYPGADSVRTLFDLNEDIDDIDYDFYEKKAEELLADLGVE